MEKESILIVEDDMQVLSSFERILSDEGYNITAVDSGEKALILLKEHKYNLIISDIEMREVDGLKVLEEIKKVSPETVVIFITGYKSTDTTIEALRKGAIDHILKSCNEEEIKMRVRLALEKQRLEQEALKAEMYKKISETLGGVAHEINNPLTTIIGNAELLTLDKSIDYPMYKQLKVIERSAERIAEIVEKMGKVKGIETKRYTKDSEIIDIQKSSEFKSYEEKSVLIVDDEETITSLYSKALRREGYKVDTAESGIKALDMVNNKNYSVIILDLSMPEMDGYETLQNLNKYYTDKKVQIPETIMITGYDVEDILKKCRNIGAFAALQKPIKILTLVETVKKAEEFFKKNRLD